MLNGKTRTRRSFIPSAAEHHLYRNTRSGELLVFMFAPDYEEWVLIASGTQHDMLVLRREVIEKKNREAILSMTPEEISG